MVVLGSSRSAYVSVCARDDTQVVWIDAEGDDFHVINETTTESCGVGDQIVVTSSIFKRTSGAHEFKVELVSTSCESGERPTLSASCECGDITSGKDSPFLFSIAMIDYVVQTRTSFPGPISSCRFSFVCITCTCTCS